MIRNSFHRLRSSELKKYFIKFARYKSTSKKTLSTNEKFDVQLSKSVEEEYVQGKFGTKYHPAIMSVPCVELPKVLVDAVQTVREEMEYPESALNKDANELVSHLYRRQPPPEKGELEETVNLITTKLVQKNKLSSKFIESESAALTINDMTKQEKSRFQNSLRSHVYNWHPLKFDDYLSFVYLWGRLAPDYAALIRIFTEIKRRQKDFVPRTLFDFGSGVGSVTWAADTIWPKDIEEIYNVDTSSSMNNLSEKLLKGGRAEDSLIKRSNTTYFRQFLPASESMKYDLIVSSRTLFELPDMKTRAKTADILWRKVAPGGFLVFVEIGSYCSYSMLLEVRDYLLEVSKLEREKYEMESPIHVFAPCPHDKFCPRFHHPSKKSCHFSILYNSPFQHGESTEKFSYVIFQKKERNENENWPRIVQPLLRRNKHLISRTCTPEGAIREFVVTKAKQGSSCYQLCKKCKWGDFLPVDILNDYEGKDSRTEQHDEHSNNNETESSEEENIVTSS